LTCSQARGWTRRGNALTGTTSNVAVLPVPSEVNTDEVQVVSALVRSALVPRLDARRCRQAVALAEKQ
jgi:hypothetical protein